MKCIKGHEIEILKSAAGYYVGTRDENGLPYCRISDYRIEPGYKSDYDFARMFYAIENQFCNGKCHCITGKFSVVWYEIVIVFNQKKPGDYPRFLL